MKGNAFIPLQRWRPFMSQKVRFLSQRRQDSGTVPNHFGTSRRPRVSENRIYILPVFRSLADRTLTTTTAKMSGQLLLTILVPLALIVVTVLTILNLVLRRRLEERRRLPAAQTPLYEVPGQPGLNTQNYEAIVSHAPAALIVQAATLPINIPPPPPPPLIDYPVPTPVPEIGFSFSDQSAETLVPPSSLTPSLTEEEIFQFEIDLPDAPTHEPEIPTPERSLEPEYAS